MCMKLVMCSGTFDIIHPGHLYYLSESKKHGDKLIVVVARDKTTEKIKGKFPKNNENKRLEAVNSLKVVDEAILGNEGNIFDILGQLKPKVVCLGYDQRVSKEEIEKELQNRNLKAEVIRISSHKPQIYKSSIMKK